MAQRFIIDRVDAQTATSGDRSFCIPYVFTSVGSTPESGKISFINLCAIDQVSYKY